MESKNLFLRYQQLQRYVGWSPDDLERVREAGRIVGPLIPELVDDFYRAIRAHSATWRLITDGESQLSGLKKSLSSWLHQLLGGMLDEDYVAYRAHVGRRHVAIGLEQGYATAAMSRLRCGLTALLKSRWPTDEASLLDAVCSINKLLDLDLAIIQDAYENEHVRRQRAAERARMRNALHQEKEFSAGLLEQAQTIVLVLDVHGHIVRYNPYLEDLTGIAPREVKGHNWLDVFIPERERERLKEVFEQTVRSDTAGTVSSLITRQGEERRISWSHKSLKNVQGKTVAVLSVGQDITELNRAQQRALQAERLAGIGQMSTGLAHESRNALQRIQACAEMLELEVEGNHEALDLVRRIKAAQDHMHRLFDEVRGYAAPVNLDRSDCNLGSAWREAWEILMPQWERRIAELIELTPHADLAFFGDHFRLVQMFRILFENSLSACQDPVRIEISCGPSVWADCRATRVSVRDNGPGLDAHQREHVFEPFFTTKTKGTGLGMAIARRIVEAHGGDINLADGTRPGAEIIIILPHQTPE